MTQQQLAVINRPVAELKLNPRNARTHSARQIRQIADSIRAFGFTNAILIDAENVIIAGAGRFAAAKKLGLTEVPTIRIDWLTPEQLRAYILADNKLAENAGWDREILQIEFQALLEVSPSILDITVTGFEVAEIDSILQGTHEDPADEIPEIEEGKSRTTESGDIWRLGSHRVICGSSLHEITFRSILGSRRAAGVFTDPPYNVRIDGNATGKGSIRHREFQMASGDMSEAEFVAFLSTVFGNMCRFSSGNSVHFTCMDWRHARELLAASDRHYSSLLNICVWVKDNGGMGSFYRSRTNSCLYSERVKSLTATIFSSADSAGTERTSGTIQVSRPSPVRATREISLRFIPRSNPSLWSPMRCSIAPRAERSFWTHFLDQELH